MKVYQGTRAGDYGTAIIVRQLGSENGCERCGRPRHESAVCPPGPPGPMAAQVEYPLPFVDKYEHERRWYGTTIPGATTVEQRTFEWGYRGTGPADTAASILADWYGQPQPIRVVQRFKEDIVAGLGGPERGGWELTGDQVQAWVGTAREVIDRAWADAREDARLTAASAAADEQEREATDG